MSEGSKMTQVAWQGARQREWAGTARTDASGTGSGGAIAPAGPMSPAGLADDSGAHPGTQRAQRAGEQARTGGEVILDLQHISLSFGGVKALTDISFNVCEHEVRAIIGPNGAGKSSMLNVINGVYHPQQGRIVFRGEERKQMHPTAAARQGIARTFQNIALFKGMTVLDNIMTGRNTQFRTGLFAHALWWGPARNEEMRHRQKVEEVIDFLEIQSIRKTPVGRLPYGLQKRVELARALAAEPSMLLLDEPMAGMNVEEKQDMCRFILDVNRQFGTTIVLIEHDMGVVMDISDRVVVLDYGKKIGDGTPEEVKGNPDVIKAYLGTSH
ncbi:ABC transporter ATPase [Cupriavidus necator]|uniref:ABC transporter ATPase n=2 Tax=Cupriavidus necator TaxID=106590 RepID=A0A1K0ILY9_CUPNE|nr:ABC transporter ATPase [Cupriavidus necator]